MTAALIILASLLLVGSILYIHHRYTYGSASSADMTRETDTEPGPEVSEGTESREQECCGMHITCEKDSLLAAVSPTVEYYDDEELDAYRGRRPDAYTDPEIEQFRDVLLTLLPQDIAGWARSLQLREISLPEPVRDELLMIVAEARMHT